MVEKTSWAEAAAAQGVATAMTRLGKMVHDALGGPRDARLAAQWWAKAAELGGAVPACAICTAIAS